MMYEKYPYRGDQMLETAELQNYYYPPYITLAHVFHAPEQWVLPTRLLNQYQFQYIHSGEIRFHIDGDTYQGRGGDLFIIPPQVPHAIERVEGAGYVGIAIVFHYGSSGFPIDSLYLEERYVGNYAADGMENQLSQLVFQYQQPGLLHQMECQLLLTQILLRLAKMRYSDEQANNQVKHNLSKFVLIKNYIDDHYNEALTDSELARISGISKNYMIMQFKRFFSLTPLQYLLWVRVQKAKELALLSNLSIGEIANRVGYQDVHSFGRMFKKKTGCSLTQFTSTLYSAPV